MGAGFKDAGGLLAAFGRAMGEDIDIADVSFEQVRAFAFGNDGYSRRKHNALTGFYRYAVNRGYVTESPLPSAVPKSHDPFTPYIYSRDEVRRLLEATSSYRKTNRCLEPHTFRAILLLLYGAGLRVSEALHLTLDNVDLQSAVLTIRNTKFNKTRWVPLGPELQKALMRYATTREQQDHSCAASAPFFVERAGTHVPHNTIGHAFQTLRNYAGVVRADNAACQPRMHDLRHTFALHRLISWYREGADVQKLLPQLSTYMGHIDIASTQWYLTMTTDLLLEASARFEQYAFQEVCHD
jgi:site-specific recombinase XerD